MHLHRGAVLHRRADGDLELARQEREFGVEGRPLPDRLAPHPRVVDLLGGGSGIGVGGGVADAVAAGLDGVHPDLGQLVQDIGRVAQLDPVELQVGAGREVAVALVVGARHMRQPAQLDAVQRSIGDGDPQHVGVQLQVQAVHQADHLELVFGDLARQTPPRLFAELGGPVGQHFLVDLVVAVHGAAGPYLRLIRLTRPVDRAAP